MCFIAGGGGDSIEIDTVGNRVSLVIETIPVLTVIAFPIAIGAIEKRSNLS